MTDSRQRDVVVVVEDVGVLEQRAKKPCSYTTSGTPALSPNATREQPGEDPRQQRTTLSNSAVKSNAMSERETVNSASHLAGHSRLKPNRGL